MGIKREVLHQLLSLPVKERAELIDELLLSLEHPQSQIMRQWADEAENRLDAYEAGRIKAVSLEDVLKKYK